MPRVDWEKELSAGKRGLAVDGKYDQIVIEGFLDVGQNQGLWSNWRGEIAVLSAGSSPNVLKDVRNNARVFGIVDGDWRTQAEIDELQAENPRVYVLSRVMIENYLINPQDLETMFPPRITQEQSEQIQTEIASHYDEWLQQGALWQVTHEQGADYFCRKHDGNLGFPNALRQPPPINEGDLRETLEQWYSQLHPDTFMNAYHTKLADFRDNGTYEQCIYGKDFFPQVVCQALNRVFGQRDADQWVDDLVNGARNLECPSDIAPILQTILQFPLV